MALSPELQAAMDRTAKMRDEWQARDIKRIAEYGARLVEMSEKLQNDPLDEHAMKELIWTGEYINLLTEQIKHRDEWKRADG